MTLLAAAGSSRAVQAGGDSTQLRNAVDAASDGGGWASMANVGHIITKQRSDFVSRNYGYATQ